VLNDKSILSLSADYTMTQFQIRKGDLSQHRLVKADADVIREGQIRVAVRQFAVTSNNITYAVTGDQLGYWKFYPPIGDDTEGWGAMPVWGFGEVVESLTDSVLVPVGRSAGTKLVRGKAGACGECIQ